MASVMQEIEACISFIEHYVFEYSDNYVPFHSCPLKDAITEICFAPVRSRKVIALYLHNQNDAFSKMICTSLEQLKNIIDKTFYIIGWDINNEAYHSALKKSLDVSINFEPAKQLIDKKLAALLIIYPIENSVTIFSILHGATVKIKDVISTFEQIQQSFEDELQHEIGLEDIENLSCSLNDIGSKEFQQLMHDRLANRDYDCFEFDEHDLLKDKIAFSKYGPPKSESGYDKKQIKSIKETYKQVVKFNNEYAEWTNQVVVSFVYNCLEPLPAEKLSRAKKYPDYNPKTDITPTPIYVVRKCKGSKDPCKIFIDQDNRAYDSWKNYLEDNKLHRCAMVVPEKGFYRNTEDNNVLIERHLSPSCGIGQMVLKGTDIATTLVGLASGGIVIAAMIPTLVVAPVALTVATATGIGIGIYSMIRSAVTIYDRHIHGENMSFANSGARGAYINIIAGSLGFVGAGATTAVTQLATKGIDIGQGAQVALNTIRMMNVSAAGVSFANSTVDVVNDWMNDQEKPSYLTFLQLKSSVLFFTNYNVDSSANDLDDKSKTEALRNYFELLECNEGRKRKKSLDSIAYGTEMEEKVLPIVTICDTLEISEMFKRNSKLLPNNIIFTIKGEEIYFNGLLVKLFKYSSKHISNWPSTILNTTEIGKSFTLLDLELDHLSVNNPNFSSLAKLLLQGLHDTLISKLWGIFKRLVQVIDIALLDTCLVFTKQESLTAILEWLLNFLEYKASEKEHLYIQVIQNEECAEISFNINFESIKNADERAFIWFEKCIEECDLNELLQYQMSKLAEKIFCYCDIEEKRQRREVNTTKNAFKVNCRICNGYYFSKKKYK